MPRPKRQSQVASEVSTPTPSRAGVTVSTRSSTRLKIAKNLSSSPASSTVPSTAPSTTAGDGDGDGDDGDGGDDTINGHRAQSDDDDGEDNETDNGNGNGAGDGDGDEKTSSKESPDHDDKWGFERLAINRRLVAQLQKYASKDRSDITDGTRYAVLSTMIFATLRLNLMLASAGVVDHGDWMTRKLVPTWKTGLICFANITEFMMIWQSKATSSQAACMVGLSHMPYYSLLIDFYNVRPTTVIVLAALCMLSVMLPCTKRPPYQVVQLKSYGLTSFLTTLVTVTNLYTVAVYVAYRTFLPQLLGDFFSDVPDKSIFREGGYSLFFFLMRRMLFAGLFARYLFLVGPLAHAKHMEKMGKGEGEELSANELASLGIYRRWLSSLTYRGRKLSTNVSIVVASLIMNTTAELSLTLPGIKWYGAALYSGVFVMPTLAIGAWSTKRYTADFKLRRTPTSVTSSVQGG